jgi:hypothetical protein
MALAREAAFPRRVVSVTLGWNGQGSG